MATTNGHSRHAFNWWSPMSSCSGPPYPILVPKEERKKDVCSYECFTLMAPTGQNLLCLGLPLYESVSLPWSQSCTPCPIPVCRRVSRQWPSNEHLMSYPYEYFTLLILYIPNLLSIQIYSPRWPQNFRACPFYIEVCLLSDRI